MWNRTRKKCHILDVISPNLCISFFISIEITVNFRYYFSSNNFFVVPILRSNIFLREMFKLEDGCVMSRHLMMLLAI